MTSLCPATPNGVLAKTIQAIVSEEAARIGLSVRIVEQGGISIKQQLVRLDLTGCFYPDCYLCESGTTGGSHTRSGAHYSVSPVTRQGRKPDMMVKLEGMPIGEQQNFTNNKFYLTQKVMVLLNTSNCSTQSK